MSEPFAFLDDGREKSDSGIAWLPLIMSAVALIGFISLPIIKIYKTEYAIVEPPIPEADPPVIVQAGVDAPPLGDEVSALEAFDVDATLSGLGDSMTRRVISAEPRLIERRVTRRAVTGITSEQNRRDLPRETPEVTEFSSLKGTPPSRKIVVEAGDTLYGISRRTGTPIEVLAGVNQLTSHDLKIGQVLRIPTR